MPSFASIPSISLSLSRSQSLPTMLPISYSLRHSLRSRLRNLHRHLRFVSTNASPPPLSAVHVPLNHPTFLVWSANTSLGKTLVSTGLASSFLLLPSSSSSSSSRRFVYLKPIQTGFPLDSDSRFVFSKLSSLSLHLRTPLSLAHSVLRSSLPAAESLSRNAAVCELGMCDLDFHEERKVSGAPELLCKTLYAWEAAVSPHLAADRENASVEDSVVLQMLEKCLREETESRGKMERSDALCIVETAGGVASPGPSGRLQCDLYR